MGTSDRLQDIRKERRAFVRRRILSILVVFVVIICCYLFINSSFFAVGNVIVEGNNYISNSDVFAIAGISERINIFRLDTTDTKNRLMKDLRIAQVDVTRQFPATVVISLKERQPYAYVAMGYGFAEVDDRGTILAVFKTLKQCNVPMITGIKLGNVYVGDQITSVAATATLAYLSAISENSLNQLSEINVSDPMQIHALTIHSIQIRLGAQEHLADKALLTDHILTEIGDKKELVEFVDLRYATPYIKFK